MWNDNQLLSPLPTPASSCTTRRAFIWTAAASFLPRLYALSASPTHEQAALTDSLRKTSAVATVLEQQSGRIRAAHGNQGLTNTPGSLLKPLLLFKALQQNLVTPATSVFCKRDLRISGRPYPCTHPQSNISFNAQEALAYSCNTWFATLALRFSPSDLVEALHAFHLHPVLAPRSQERNQLLTLGLSGITVSPSEMAAAYRILGNQLHQPFAKTIADGLRDSVSFGMAHNAETSATVVSGKTGTADNPPRQPWSHGWFSGFATVRGTPLVLSLYLPQGNGADAAHLAQNFFLKCAGTTS